MTRIAHNDCGGQVDLRAQRAAASGTSPFHAFKEVRFSSTSLIAVGETAGLPMSPQYSFASSGVGVADAGKTVLDQLDGVLVVLFQSNRCRRKKRSSSQAQPMRYPRDGVDKLDVLLGRVGIVHTKIAQAAEALGGAGSRWSAPCSGRCADSRSAQAGNGCGPADRRPPPQYHLIKASIKFLPSLSATAALTSSAILNPSFLHACLRQAK